MNTTVEMIVDNITGIYAEMFEKIVQLEKDGEITTYEMFYLIDSYSKYCIDDTNNATTEYITGVKAEYHSKDVAEYMEAIKND